MKRKKERNDKPGHKVSSNKSIMLSRAMLQLAPPRCPSSLSFSLPKVSTYAPSLLKNVRNSFQTPLKDFHLLRGFSSKGFVIPKQSFQTWSVYRTPSFKLLELKEYKSSSHLTPCPILYMSKLTMLYVEVLNSWSNSLQPGGHDANQVNKEMPKDANLHNEKSSQSRNLIRGRIVQGSEHLKFFLLVFLMFRI